MSENDLVLPELSRTVIGCAMRVHSALGRGLLESIYEECLSREMTAVGVVHQRQVPVPIQYRGATLDCRLRIDLLVESKVVVEVKAVADVLPVHESQLLTYLRLTRLPLGLLLNFNVDHMRDGIRRRVLTHLPPSRIFTSSARN